LAMTGGILPHNSIAIKIPPSLGTQSLQSWGENAVAVLTAYPLQLL
jgi:hypothetical protein